MTFGCRFSAIRPFALISLLALLGLTGCAKVYDDTKGWGNDVEAWFRRDVIQGIKTSFENIDEEPGATAVAQAPAMTEPKMSGKPISAPATAPGTTEANKEVQLASTAAEIPAVTTNAGRRKAATPGQSTAENIYPQTAGRPASEPAMAKTAAAPSPLPAKQHKAAKAGQLALHLSSNKTKKAAIQEWAQLKSAFPDQLKNLQLEVTRADLGKKGVFYRVMAGPFPDKPAAARTCAALKKKEQYCAVMPAPNVQS